MQPALWTRPSAPNVEYCYQVFGYDFAGNPISASEEVCIVA